MHRIPGGDELPRLIQHRHRVSRVTWPGAWPRGVAGAGGREEPLRLVQHHLEGPLGQLRKGACDELRPLADGLAESLLHLLRVQAEEDPAADGGDRVADGPARAMGGPSHADEAGLRQVHLKLVGACEHAWAAAHPEPLVLPVRLAGRTKAILTDHDAGVGVRRAESKRHGGRDCWWEVVGQAKARAVTRGEGRGDGGE
eukprot:CAMPEP_0175402644 /NCGR_PEP_ID=MMETSP0095-20121207/37623_1 /TAXON_ID=311494 /ORGANISM="Alexandrium monilatum, Strain CCMP3105" /LENGTH=198 /DNA_ID=CAMNT_0016701417 /DNA_START=113 /DNA_END=707 /DNA_ORIENTATION=-